MKKFRFLLFAYFVSLTMGASAYDFSAKNADGKQINYDIISSTNLTCEVVSNGEYYGNINIPASVSYNGKTYSVTSIGEWAFYNCTGLTLIEIPNSVTSIRKSAFSGCSGLTSVIIGNSVTSIESYAFYDCTGLTSIGISNSVTSIGEYAFSYCSGLTSIEIPNSVTSIGEFAFHNCTGLTSVDIPNSVTSIGECAFSGCSGLKSIIVESGNKYYDSRENCNAIIETATNTLLAGCNNTIIPNSVMGIGRYAFSGCSGLISIDVPNSVTSIGGYAFNCCSSLTSITIPNSVTSIGNRAFSDCSSLSSIKLPWKRPLSVPSETFYNVDKSKCTLYVPKGTETLYWVAPVWSEFTNIVEYDEPEDVSYYITINGLDGGEIMQKVDIGMTYSYKFKPYEEWEINSVTFNGVDVTSQLHDSIFSTPAIAGNSTLSVVYKKVSSAIDAVEGNDDVRVLATSGAIVINGAKFGKTVSVYGLNGNMVESTKTNGVSTTVSLTQKGVYIVKVGNDVFKVSI